MVSVLFLVHSQHIMTVLVCVSLHWWGARQLPAQGNECLHVSELPFWCCLKWLCRVTPHYQFRTSPVSPHGCQLLVLSAFYVVANVMVLLLQRASPQLSLKFNMGADLLAVCDLPFQVFCISLLNYKWGCWGKAAWCGGTPMYWSRHPVHS